MINRQILRKKRHQRLRSKIFGTAQIPRLSIFRSLNHIYAQLIDDTTGKTLIASSDQMLEKKSLKPLEKAHLVGQLIAKKANSKKITKVIFDKSGYRYHGQIRALADGARKSGLKF